jgi:hypothetical protein
VKIKHAAGLGLLLAALTFAVEKGFNPPPAAPPNTYPAHETHDDEKVTIAIDPFDTPEKAVAFQVRYSELGFLPVRLIIGNDGDKPLMLDKAKIQLVTGANDQIAPATEDDIFRRLARPEKATGRSKVQLPIPLPHDKNPIKKEARDEVSSALFRTVPVTGHSSNNGFLFFDVLGVKDPAAGAHLYISGIRAGSQELFYFDIPLKSADKVNGN